MYRQPGGQLVDMQPVSQVQIGRYRRNRKLQSCEPCRKSKLACDHNVPCGRCVRRRRVGQCYYHPNPLTRNPQSTGTIATTGTTIASISPPLSLPGNSEDPQGLISSTESHQPSIHQDSVAWQQTTSRLDTTLHRASSAPPLETKYEDSSAKPGFLGLTSYSSFITDSLDTVGVASVNLYAAPLRNITVSSDRIAKGCQILSFLQDRVLIDQLVYHLFESSEGQGDVPGKIMTKQLISEMWRVHGDTLQSQNPEKIRQLCQALFKNTQRPLKFSGSTTPSQFALLGTGINLRWEVIGSIAIYVGNYACFIDSSKGLLRKRNIDPATLLSQMYEVAEACLEFCRELDSIGDMFLWLLYGTCGLIESARGDASYETYRMSAELNSAVVMMGFHQKVEPNEQVPFFLAEMRKRVRAIAYIREIGTASFLGRPPRISYRHWNLDPPLDLHESQLVLRTPEELSRLAADLDEYGLNRNREMSHETFIITWMTMSKNREDILDLAMGEHSREEMLRRADDIQRRMDQHYARVPEFMLSMDHGELDIDPAKLIHTGLRITYFQATLANKLLLQRVLVRKAGVDSSGLIQVALTVLRSVIKISEQGDRFPEFSTQIDLILVFHGLRSAATVAVELLKQEQLPEYPEEPLLPRSQTIQELAVFTSRLSRVNGPIGPVSIYGQGQKVMSRILDKILSPSNTAKKPCAEPHDPSQNPDTTTLADGPGETVNLPDNFLTMGDFDFSFEAPLFGHDYDFKQWLEQVDWEQVA